MKQIVIILVLTSVILIVNCGTQENPCSLSEEVWSDLKKTDSILKDTARIRIYAGIMKYNYDEPDLYNADHETYRYVKSCVSWYSYTKVVRIEKLKNHYKATIKEFVDTIEKGVLTPIKNYKFELSKKDWQLVKDKIQEDNFWISNALNSGGYLHGCSWSLEGYKPKKDKCSLQKYHGIAGNYPVDSLYLTIYELFDNLEQRNVLQHKNKPH